MRYDQQGQLRCVAVDVTLEQFRAKCAGVIPASVRARFSGRWWRYGVLLQPVRDAAQLCALRRDNLRAHHQSTPALVPFMTGALPGGTGITGMGIPSNQRRIPAAAGRRRGGAGS